METASSPKAHVDRKVWFSMWFLGAIITFGIAFFPMFYRLVDGRNRHLVHQRMFEEKTRDYLRSRGREASQSRYFKPMNAKLWAASIILIIPAFLIMYKLTRDLALHEHDEDAFLASALPERVFMPQTIPQTTYALITIVTLGLGGVYWLYKLVNLYNAHYKADLQAQKVLAQLTEDEKPVEHM